MNIGKTGAEGEKRVAEYLKSRGCLIAARNYRTRFGEIDVIAEDRTHIIFTEVKTRREGYLVSGAESVDLHKQRRIRLAAEEFLSKLHIPLEPRFDVAEVTVYKKADGSDGYRLNYIEGAF